MKCNGCGADDIDVGGVFAYGHVETSEARVVGSNTTHSDHAKTLCPNCARVLKSIILNSDLSDHWEKEDL